MGSGYPPGRHPPKAWWSGAWDPPEEGGLRCVFLEAFFVRTLLSERGQKRGVWKLLSTPQKQSIKPSIAHPIRSKAPPTPRKAKNAEKVPIFRVFRGFYEIVPTILCFRIPAKTVPQMHLVCVRFGCFLD